MRERSPLRWQPKARVSQFAWVRSNPVWGHYPCCRTGTDAAPSAGKWSTVLATSSICSSLQTERSPPALGRGVMWGSLWRRLSVGHCEGAAVSRAPWGWRHRRSSTVKVAPPSSTTGIESVLRWERKLIAMSWRATCLLAFFRLVYDKTITHAKIVSHSFYS